MQQATLTCPHCNHTHQHILHPFIDLGKQPKQKLAILTDSLFSVNCPACHKQYTVLHELLVVNENEEFALMLIPNTEEAEIPGSVTGRQNLETYTLRLVASTASLKEKLLLLERHLDDRVIELSKLYLSLQFQDKPYQLFFADKTDGKLIFSVLDEQGTLQGSVNCEDELYTQLQETTKRFPVKEGYFTLVDQNWAASMIKESSD